MSRGRGSGEREVLEAAGVGHRITHDDLPDPRTLVVSVLRTLVNRPRRGGALASELGRSLSRDVLAELGGDDPGDSPDPCGEIPEGSPNTFLGRDKRPAALLDDELDIPCEDHEDGPMKTGAAHVFVNGKPLARRSDELNCGALVGEGEPTILVGAERTEKTESRGQRMGGQNMDRGAAASARYSRALAGERRRDVGGRRGRGRAGGAQIGAKLVRGGIAAIIGLLTR